MKKLLDSIERLKKSPIKKQIDLRAKEFEALGQKRAAQIFNELCFCLMTANFNAQRSIDIQKAIGDGFHTFSPKQMAQKLKALGHRFPNTRAKFIIEARKHKSELSKFVKTRLKDYQFRDWLVKNVKGLGHKEASHFLRNIGRKDCAIIDFHILDLLQDCGLVKKKKPISKKIYLEVEEILKNIAKKSGLDLGKLDLYLWYLETGKILK